MRKYRHETMLDVSIEVLDAKGERERQQMKIVIVGGVALGAGVAARARRLDESAEIIVLERGPYVSFANCGLPYYIGGEIVDRSKLLLHTPESLHARFRLDVRTEQEVIRLDRGAHVVTVKNIATGEVYDLTYDRLVLAQGATAIRPALPGLPATNVVTLRTIPDMDVLDQIMHEETTRRVALLGAGFIGLELAEGLLARGIQVTLIDRASQVLPPMDEEMTVPAMHALQRAGVRLVLGDGIRGFVKDPVLADSSATKVSAVVLESGRVIEADAFIMGLGVRPEIAVAADAGLQMGPTGALRVNAMLQTSDPDVYAGGDMAETTHAVTGNVAWIALAGPANKQARVIADHIFHRGRPFAGTLGTSIVRFQDVVLAQTGLTEKQARQQGLSYLASYTLAGHHASYYPGAEDMHIKLLVAPQTGELLGGQITGNTGVDKRIDVLATALHARMNVYDLSALDLAYAPPFSSAKDPIIMAALAAQNVLEGRVHTVQNDPSVLEQGAVQWVDVRERPEFEAGHIPGALSIPLSQLRERLADIVPEQPVILYCHSGMRSYVAACVLQQSGYDHVWHWAGGIENWRLFHPQAEQ